MCIVGGASRMAGKKRKKEVSVGKSIGILFLYLFLIIVKDKVQTKIWNYLQKISFVHYNCEINRSSNYLKQVQQKKIFVTL